MTFDLSCFRHGYHLENIDHILCHYMGIDALWFYSFLGLGWDFVMNLYMADLMCLWLDKLEHDQKEAQCIFLWCIWFR